MAKPNNARCPRCRAKMKMSCGPSVTYNCRRCGYQKSEEMDNLTKTLLFGPLYRTKKSGERRNDRGNL